MMGKMENKKLLTLINETISTSEEFDFLGLRRSMEEENIYKVLSDISFQSKFLYDLFFSPNKIEQNTSEATISTENQRNSNDGVLNIDYTTMIRYEFDQDTIFFELCFHGENVEYKIRNSEIDGQEKIYIDWDDIAFDVYTKTGDRINFKIFEKIDNKIRRLFISKYLGYFIENKIIS